MIFPHDEKNAHILSMMNVAGQVVVSAHKEKNISSLLVLPFNCSSHLCDKVYLVHLTTQFVSTRKYER